MSAPLVYVGTASAEELAKVDIRGKAVAYQFSGQPTDGISFRRYLTASLRDKPAELVKAGAVAVVVVSDARAEAIFEHWGHTYERGRFGLPGDANLAVTTQAPTVWLPASAAAWVQQAGQQFVADLLVETFQYPSVNIVAKAARHRCPAEGSE